MSARAGTVNSSLHSPIAMKRDGNFRANNDENVAVESLSIIEKTSFCSCMKSRYKIDILLIC